MTTIVKPSRRGTLVKWIGEAILSIAPGFDEVGAVAIIHDSGPLNSAQFCVDFPAYLDLYGDSDTPGRTAVAGAFAGGAGGLYIFRMGVASGAGHAAKATVTVQNTAGTPASALTLTAKTEGVRGNRFGYILATNAIDSTKGDFTLTLDGQKAEPTITYTKTDVTSLAAAINLRSKLVDAAMLVTGTALATTTGTALTGGVDGSTLTSTEWQAALNAFEYMPTSLFAPYDLTDPTITAQVLSWVRAQESANRPVICVTGGPAAETLSAALTRAASIADPHMVTLGIGTWHDDLLGKDLSTSQLAPRVMGMLAKAGRKSSLTFKKMDGIHPTVSGPGAASDEVTPAINGGLVIFTRSVSEEALLKIEAGVTTFTSTTTAGRPYDVFSDARLVRIMDLYVREIKMWGDDHVIGDLPVNDDTRRAVYAQGTQMNAELLRQGLILPANDTANPPVPAPFFNVEVTNDDTIPFDFGFQFARTANYVLGKGHVR